jgi:hypothetical protein
MMRIARSLLVLGAVSLMTMPVSAITFLGFPSAENIDAARIRRWEAGAAKRPFTLSYAIDEDFFEDYDGLEERSEGGRHQRPHLLVRGQHGHHVREGAVERRAQ